MPSTGSSSDTDSGVGSRERATLCSSHPCDGADGAPYDEEADEEMAGFGLLLCC